MAKHMGLDERKRIEFLLGCGNTTTQIAKALGRAQSTVTGELLARRIDSMKRYGCSNTLCAHFDECELRLFNGFDDRRLRKSQPRCFEFCPRFAQAVCHRLGSSPFVCNGCEREHNCPLPKKFYVARAAQENYEGVLRNCRAGIRQDDASVAKMDAVLSPCVRNGQSVRNVIANNPGLFEGVAVRTAYDWINGGVFSVRKHDQPHAEFVRRPVRKLETRTTAQCRVNRTYQDMLNFLEENPGVVPTEIDTVVGSVSGKVLFTMVVRHGLALAFLRDAKTSQTCTRIFNMLWELAGPDLFRAMFRVLLPDNGPEFNCPEMIENYRPDPVHNPTKLLPRGVNVFYADPYRSTQKPHVERIHEEIRRILVKGVSFNPLTQDSVDLVMSHVNSYTREALGGLTGYDHFVREFGAPGRDLLGKLGIRRIPANQVTLHPFLLGRRFQKAADAAILRRNGVAAKNAGDGSARR